MQIPLLVRSQRRPGRQRTLRYVHYKDALLELGGVGEAGHTANAISSSAFVDVRDWNPTRFHNFAKRGNVLARCGEHEQTTCATGSHVKNAPRLARLVGFPQLENVISSSSCGGLNLEEDRVVLTSFDGMNMRTSS